LCWLTATIEGYKMFIIKVAHQRGTRYLLKAEVFFFDINWFLPILVEKLSLLIEEY